MVKARAAHVTAYIESFLIHVTMYKNRKSHIETSQKSKKKKVHTQRYIYIYY